MSENNPSEAEVIIGEIIEANQIVPSTSSGQVPSTSSEQGSHVPIVSRLNISIRLATLDDGGADLAFVDRLQKAQSREVGFLPTAALEGKIRLNEVLIAEVAADDKVTRGQGDKAKEIVNPSPGHPLTLSPAQTPVGYIMAADRYFKRDEVGYITQINVEPNYRRSLVAGMLLQAQFDRSAYGCRLYSCWCAQDLKANEFWEAMGFTAIAFRTGSRTKGKDASGKKSARIHIFWQKRVRADDVTTPWWYPHQTGGGELREDRLVFPIPPGTSWRDVLPVVLSGQSDELKVMGDASSGTAESSAVAPQPAKPTRAKKVAREPKYHRGLWFAHEAVVEKVERTAEEKKGLKESRKIDPRLTKMARELRDWWMENAQNILPAPANGTTKHDVKRLASDSAMNEKMELRSLPMAA